MFDARISALLKTHYGLEHVAVAQKFATNGRREAYLLETEAGRFVLKITDPNRAEEVVRSDVGILATVARFDFPAPRPLYTRDRRLYLSLDERFFYLYQFVPGEKPQPSAAMLAECGALLARLHTLPVDETARVSQHRPDVLLAETREWLLDAPDTPEQQEMARRMLATIAAFPSFEGLPETLIHTDPYFVNLVAGADGQLYLIDWEDAGISFPLIDVGYLGHLSTYLPHDRQKLGLAGEEPITWRPDWAQAFLDGYQAVRKLTRREQELFPWAVRLNYLMYIWDWDQRRIIPENYQRMLLLEELRPLWR
jgi:Ser/Thr protein kinase RdoA (MazF antagonist)